ncbi:RNA polymerase-binding protein DksA [Geopseudomonas aromaticivorans]
MTQEELLQQPESNYMNADQKAFFRNLLVQQKNEVVTRMNEQHAQLKQFERYADAGDVASLEESRQWQIRLMERDRLLSKKIDEALQRIHDDEYGYCALTGSEIGLARLLARPTTDLSVEAKEIQELKERCLAG